MAEKIKVCATESSRRGGRVDRILQDVYHILPSGLTGMVARMPREFALSLASTSAYLLDLDGLNRFTSSMSVRSTEDTTCIPPDWATGLPVSARVVARG